MRGGGALRRVRLLPGVQVRQGISSTLSLPQKVSTLPSRFSPGACRKLPSITASKTSVQHVPSDFRPLDEIGDGHLVCFRATLFEAGVVSLNKAQLGMVG
jgi:hypothetical protein